MDVIILNGASSSGKSTIAKELQAQLPEYFLHIGIDTFIAMMPEHANFLSSSDVVADGFYWQTLPTENGNVQRIRSGDYGKRVNSVYHSTINHFANMGLKVIVDDVMNGGAEQLIWRTALKELDVIFVGVMCSNEELLRREKLRDDRINGSALEQNSRVHKNVEYDLTVSSTENSVLECAQKIAIHITNAGY
jgi:chloramphenicol 3-O phosphotransferase